MRTGFDLALRQRELEVCRNLQKCGERVSPQVAAAMAYAVVRLGETVCLQDLAAAAGISRFALCRAFHAASRRSPMRWLWTLRVLLAHEIFLRSPSLSVMSVALLVGFSDAGHFCRRFRATFGQPPSRAICRGQGWANNVPSLLITGSASAEVDLVKLALAALRAETPRDVRPGLSQKGDRRHMSLIN